MLLFITPIKLFIDSHLVDVRPERGHLVAAVVERASAGKHGEEQHARREHVAGRVAAHRGDVFRCHIVHARLYNIRYVRVPLLKRVVSLVRKRYEMNVVFQATILHFKTILGSGQPWLMFSKRICNEMNGVLGHNFIL